MVDGYLYAIPSASIDSSSGDWTGLQFCLQNNKNTSDLQRQHVVIIPASEEKVRKEQQQQRIITIHM